VQILIVVENHLHSCISLQVGLTLTHDPLKHNNKNPHHENTLLICLQNYLLKNKLVFLQKIKIMLDSCSPPCQPESPGVADMAVLPPSPCTAHLLDPARVPLSSGSQPQPV